MRELDGSKHKLVDPEGAEARARADFYLRIARSSAAVQHLKKAGRCAIIAQESPLKDFRQGVDSILDSDKRGRARTLWLPADGNIQNVSNTKDRVPKTREAISTLRRSLGFVMVAFEGVDFSGEAGPGSLSVLQRLDGILTKQDAWQETYDRRRSKLGMLGAQYKNTHQRDFGVLLVGSGRPQSSSTRPCGSEAAQKSADFLASFASPMMLLASGELAEISAPAEYGFEQNALPIRPVPLAELG